MGQEKLCHWRRVEEDLQLSAHLPFSRYSPWHWFCLPRWLVSATIEVRLVRSLFTVHVLIYTCSLTYNRYIALVSLRYHRVLRITRRTGIDESAYGFFEFLHEGR